MLTPREFVQDNWAQIIADLDSLVSIPSVADVDSAQPGAPFGPQARCALDKVDEIAKRLGLSVIIDEGYVAFCDAPGRSEQQLGVIGHLDVVPAGPGWSVEPFALTKREGWYLGRGTSDDKGPILLALWALSYWCDIYDVASGGKLPHPVRIIFGSNEENGMSDVEFYRSRYEDPAFLFTPDADFPVCNGEKGMFGLILRSLPIPRDSSTISSLSAGTVPNAVPGEAFLSIKKDGSDHRFEFKGTSAHASTPEKGESALKMMLSHLLEEEALLTEERRFFELCSRFSDDFYGEAVGISCEDNFFGKLTGVAGTMGIAENRYEMSYDVRFPTSISGDEIEQRLRKILLPLGDSVDVEIVRNINPFLIDAESPQVKALLEAYNEVTGEEAKPFTMGGATYAREFSRGCSFGMQMPWIEKPQWVGGMHAPNEGVSEEQMMQALEIYIAAYEKLFEIDLV